MNQHHDDTATLELMRQALASFSYLAIKAKTKEDRAAFKARAMQAETWINKRIL